MKSYMTLNVNVTLIALIFLCCLQSAMPQGNLVSNGGFDTSAAGWTLSNGGGFSSVGGNPNGNVLLDSLSPSPSTDPTASQTINGLISGVLYSVSGDYQKQKDRGVTITPSTDNSFGVAINGIFLLEAASSTNIDLSWHSFNFFYTADSSSALLSLSSQINGTGVSYAIDNISMQLVPEPSAETLLGFGGILLLGFQRLASFYSPMKCSATRRVCGRVRCSHR